MKTLDPEFWVELMQSNMEDLPGIEELLIEDAEPNTSIEDKDTDDSDLSINALIDTMTTLDIPLTVGTRQNGTLTSLADVENMDLVAAEEVPIENPEPEG